MPEKQTEIALPQAATLTETSLEFGRELTYEEWEEAGKQLRRINAATAWWWGDWLIYGEERFPDRYSQALDESDLGYKTLRNAAYISGKIHVSRRRDNLTWSHHAEVGALEPEDQDRLLDEAEKNKWSRAQLRKAIKEYRRSLRVLASPKAEPEGQQYTLIHGDLSEVGDRIEDDSVDAIITDPPYPHEYLPLYEILARFAARALKPGGLCAVMAGQSYIPEILELMRPHLTYHWILDYRLPGATTQIFGRNVLCGWKPILWFQKGEYEGDWIWDLTKSDRPEKEDHEWGQSESGMISLIEKFTGPGDTVLDPFVGGGTTAVAALYLKRRFIGIDVDEFAIETTRARIHAVVENEA